MTSLAEQGKLSEPLQQIVESDEGLFGVDETIALGAVFTYGSIAVTTFGHLDKNKMVLLMNLIRKKEALCIRSSMILSQASPHRLLQELHIERVTFRGR